MASSKKAKSEAGDTGSARRKAIQIAAALALVTAVAVGIVYLKQYVDQRAVGAVTPSHIVLKNRPAWMPDALANQIIASVKPTRATSVFDRRPLETVSRALASNPWVAKVKEVQRAYGQAPGDTLEISCDYREPAALVKWGTSYWYVDGKCVLLPEHFSESELHPIMIGPDGHTRMRIIDGVTHAPPAPGAVWKGNDLAAGVDLARRFCGLDYADAIVTINIDNYNGREDPTEAQITLYTRYNTQIRWGQPVAQDDGVVEVKPARKFARLEEYYHKYGRVDAGQAWVDIRLDTPLWPPVSTSSSASAGGP